MAVYSRVIGIPLDKTKEIILQNEMAKLLLEQEKALVVTSDISNLQILVRATLLRDYGDLLVYFF